MCICACVHVCKCPHAIRHECTRGGLSRSGGRVRGGEVGERRNSARGSEKGRARKFGQTEREMEGRRERERGRETINEK